MRTAYAITQTNNILLFSYLQWTARFLLFFSFLFCLICTPSLTRPHASFSFSFKPFSPFPVSKWQHAQCCNPPVFSFPPPFSSSSPSPALRSWRIRKL